MYVHIDRGVSEMSASAAKAKNKNGLLLLL
jgi:hypothetical protein